MQSRKRLEKRKKEGTQHCFARPGRLTENKTPFFAPSSRCDMIVLPMQWLGGMVRLIVIQQKITPW